MKFFNFYSSLSLISTKVKNCQYLIVKRAQKTTRKLLKMSHIKAYKVDMPKILVCDVGVLTPADLFEGKKPIFSNIPFTLPQWIQKTQFWSLSSYWPLVEASTSMLYMLITQNDFKNHMFIVHNAILKLNIGLKRRPGFLDPWPPAYNNK